jgi:hypothetical protein
MRQRSTGGLESQQRFSAVAIRCCCLRTSNTIAITRHRAVASPDHSTGRWRRIARCRTASRRVADLTPAIGDSMRLGTRSGHRRLRGTGATEGRSRASSISAVPFCARCGSSTAFSFCERPADKQLDDVSIVLTTRSSRSAMALAPGDEIPPRGTCRLPARGHPRRVGSVVTGSTPGYRHGALQASRAGASVGRPRTKFPGH